MEPIFPENSKILAVKIWFSNLVCGDKVIAKDPRDNKLLLKKILKISDKKYFLIGENLDKSTDSRHFGYILKKNIIAKVLFRLG